MYSAKHHVAYWGISASATAAYGLALKLGCDKGVFRLLLVPLTILAFHTVWKGPRPQTGPPLYPVSTWCLLVSLGATTESFYIPDLDSKPIRPIIHVLLAFTVLGVLQPVRYNRRDLQQFYFLSMATDPPVRVEPILSLSSILLFLYATGFMVSLFLGIIYSVDHGLVRLYGPNISCMSILTSQFERLESHFGSAVAAIYVLGPFTDMAETIFCLVHKRFASRWIPTPGPLVSPGEQWVLVMHSTVKASIAWTMYLLIQLYCLPPAERTPLGRAPRT